ncbi:MAG TPA: hypothetical protein VFT36_13935 [Methylomirabilota bacterium]|nr:hypothetical protein [Methylomirabilota bacterium]
MAQTRRPTRRRKTTKKSTSAPVKRRAASPPAPEAAEPAAPLTAVPVSTPERAFAGRARPLPPPPPLPTARRAIFVDVENSSRADHISRVLDHLAIDRHDRRVEVIAVGNWRVIGADSARLLARRGAHLVHSAPSTGVRDWSDLRIAVSAGVWLGSARPGDLIEIVSDDRAFDAVGDVASALGVDYRRLSYRGLTGQAPSEEALAAEAAAPREGRGRRGGRGRRRGRGRGEPARGHAQPRPAPHAPSRLGERPPAAETGAQTTAPHDQLVDVVRELADHAPGGAVLIDTLARALKERGFSRPPGSPRLITRLRRIRELVVSRTGMITLADAAAPRPASDDTTDGAEAKPAADVVVDAEEVTEVDDVDGNVAPVEVGVGGAGDSGGGPRRGRRRRRRRRRGGRGGGGGAPSAPPA